MVVRTAALRAVGPCACIVHDRPVLRKGPRPLRSGAATTIRGVDTQASVTRAEDLRVWQAQYADAAPIGELVPRRKATCVGVVHKIRLVPGRGLEGTIDDGSGRRT